MLAPLRDLYRYSLVIFAVLLPACAFLGFIFFISHQSDKSIERMHLGETVYEVGRDAVICQTDNDGFISDFAYLTGEYCGVRLSKEAKDLGVEKIAPAKGTCWRESVVEEDTVTGMLNLNKNEIGICTYKQTESGKLLKDHVESQYMTVGAWNGEDVTVFITGPDGYYRCKGESSDGKVFTNWEC